MKDLYRHFRFFGVLLAAVVLFSTFALPASAGGDNRAPLQLVGGEDPGVLAGITEADVRSDGKLINVNLDNLDPARFPVGCMADVTVGTVTGRATLVNQAAEKLPLGVAAATSLDFFANGKPANQPVTVSLSCAAPDAAGIPQVHQTLWQGVLAK